MSVLETAPLEITEPLDVAWVLPKVNLLPPEIGERARLRRIQLSLAGGVLATAGVVAVLYASAASTLSDAEERLAEVTGTAASLQAETRTLSHVDDVYAQAAAARELLATAMGEEVRFSQFLDDLSKAVPEHVWLRNVTFTQSATATTETGAAGIGTVTFTGVGFRHDDVATWLESLAAQQGFANPYITAATTERVGDRTTVAFTSNVTLTADALSGRYTGRDGG